MLRRYESSPTAQPDLFGMYNPFAFPAEYTQSMANRMASMVDASVQRSLSRYFQHAQLPQLRASDLGTEYQIQANVYGYDPHDLMVEHKNGFLTISGRKATSQSDALESSETFQAFRKTVRAPTSKPTGVQAQLRGGVLTVSVPKA